MLARFVMTGALALVWSAAIQAAPPYSEWSVPQSVVPGGCPIETRDGNQLYTAAASAGSLDIWVYQRDGRVGSFGNRTRLGAPVSLDAPVRDFCPTPLTGNWLLFVSDREDTCGKGDMYLVRYRVGPPLKDGTLQQQSYGEAQRLACENDPNGSGPNSIGEELGPSVVTTSQGTFLYFSSDKITLEYPAGKQKIYRSQMGPDGSFGPASSVPSLNVTGASDQQPNVSRDGLTVVFASNRDDHGMDIFMATRTSDTAEWSTPRNLSAELGFPTLGMDETRPSLSWDLKRLYYGAGGLVYVSERTSGADND